MLFYSNSWLNVDSYGADFSSFSRGYGKWNYKYTANPSSIGVEDTLHLWRPSYWSGIWKLKVPPKKRASWCTKAPAYTRSGKGSHHLVYCTQSCPVFTQAVSRTWTRDLSVTWQQLYQMRQGYPSWRYHQKARILYGACVLAVCQQGSDYKIKVCNALKIVLVVTMKGMI